MMEVQVQMFRLSPAGKDSPRKAHCVCCNPRKHAIVCLAQPSNVSSVSSETQSKCDFVMRVTRRFCAPKDHVVFF